uniref:GAT domain-containing protein n=1 Tax=Steinernema glaseri TaxID=37863 RepID=A0A1I7ZTH8_9BILA
MAQNAQDVRKVVAVVKQLPNGTVACEDASIRLLDTSIQSSSDRLKCETVEKCFELLERDATGVMELLAALDENTEKRFVDEVLGAWEAKTETDELKRLLRERQRVLLTPTPPYASEFGASSNGFEDFSYFNAGASDSTTMRRRC